jgi:hypothetical protein
MESQLTAGWILCLAQIHRRRHVFQIVREIGLEHNLYPCYMHDMDFEYLKPEPPKPPMTWIASKATVFEDQRRDQHLVLLATLR